MSCKKNTLSALLLLVLGLTGLHAQETIPATGGNASGSGGTVSYSVGQVVYTTYNGASGSIAQGVQQPFEISVITGIEEAASVSLTISVYPNPASEQLTLRVNSFDISGLSYQLYDINGKLLENTTIEGTETNIIMSNLVPATYFLKVIQGDKDVKTFKVIKN
ncbi:MAG: T9SS type A sorting domain-containing protein [Bacteroidetes bacterium]|nr:T9SS type A sorting domain-containing protein [Bacteroidota bacterium]MBU1719648.1 T9SS type A sorting domain-containing protein [Bacteroidota bacterium]